MAIKTNIHGDADPQRPIRLSKSAPSPPPSGGWPRGFVAHHKRDRFDVYVGRPSKWGNPYTIGPDGDRAEVIAKYERWLMTQPELLATIGELRGKVLGCWCAPQACHADVLVRLANQ